MSVPIVHNSAPEQKNPGRSDASSTPRPTRGNDARSTSRTLCSHGGGSRNDACVSRRRRRRFHLRRRFFRRRRFSADARSATHRAGYKNRRARSRRVAFVRRDASGRPCLRVVHVFRVRRARARERVPRPCVFPPPPPVVRPPPPRCPSSVSALSDRGGPATTAIRGDRAAVVRLERTAPRTCRRNRRWSGPEDCSCTKR